MRRNEKLPVLRFGILEAAYWSIMATFGSYMVPFALSKGFSQSHVSVMMAFYLVCGFAGQFCWGSICDRKRTNKKVFLLGIIGASLVQLVMYEMRSALAFGLLYGLFGFCLGPMGSILDAWMLRSLHKDMKLYGISRGAGSIGFAAVVWIMGRATKAYGYFLMPICSTAAVILTVVLACSTKDVDFRDSEKESSISVRDLTSILKIPSYTLVLAMLFFISLSSAPIANLKITLLRAVGGDIDTQGLDYFIGCSAQFVLFEMAGFLIQIPAERRITLGAVATVAAILLDLFAVNQWMIIGGTAMMNVTYGLVMPGTREIVVRMIDPRYQTTAVAAVDACYSFLGGSVSMLYAGALIDHRGIAFMLSLCLATSLVPLGLQLFQRKGEHLEDESCAF